MDANNMRRNKWICEKRLEMIRAQIEETRKLKDSDGLAWWTQYTALKDKECIAEQDLAYCERWLEKMGVKDEQDQGDS